MEQPSRPSLSALDEPPYLPAVAKTLTACIRDALQRGEAAEVPELGTFRVEHRTSQAREEHEEGDLSLAPPRDEIVFDPAEE